MGCCESSSDNGLSTSYNLNASSLLTPDETILFKQILNGIPLHCQQPIINLPRRQFLGIYRYHMIASYHFRRMEFQLAILYQFKAISGLQALLLEHKDHFIFIEMYSTLATCLSVTDAVSAAIEGHQMALDMLLKHTPTDYQAISSQYYGLATCYLGGQAWGQGIQHLRKGIETARLSNELNQEDIQMMEITLHLWTAKLMNGVLMSMDDVLAPTRSQNQQNMESQITPETNADNIICGTSSINQTEVEHLPDKQTELLANDEIPKDVVQNLES
ncbi:unnamed protein product [Adineta steineri]|uniref:Uncharacterized protein n=1 Tax=Adineta steineri TaxID=433720 RepID=A0A819TN50_9BILA|nr:unnamed protein product [Adineta steineri]